MGQALYRKYRSKSLGEIVGQEHITDTLERALQQGRISHAYLFSGPRGVGKTSIARILAHEINGLEYSDDSTHMDIIEIDAASNNGVEDVRDLREKVYVAPSSAKYKVYIIDEVHMLSKAAFNALLKTLEEPPSHVVFILATTEAHKLPETIISRTQHYTFKPVEKTKVIEHLKHIAAEEDVTIDDEALALLADHGGGSFRDSISVLDQARSIHSTLQPTRGSKDHPVSITAADVRQLLGIAPDTALDELIGTLRGGGEPGKILLQVSTLYAQGLPAANIASQLAAKLRAALAGNKPLLPVSQSLQLMKQLIDVPAGRSPERLLEIVLLETVPTDTFEAPSPASPESSVLAARASTADSASAAPKTTPQVTPKKFATETATSDKAGAKDVSKQKAASAAAIQPVSHTEAPAGDSTPGTVLNSTLWLELLGNIKKQYNTLYGVLRMTRPVFTEEAVEIQCKFSFHQKRLNEAKNKQIIADFIKQLTGNEVAVTCTHAKDTTSVAGISTSTASHNSPVAPKQPVAALETISNIFGGGEVLDT